MPYAMLYRNWKKGNSTIQLRRFFMHQKMCLIYLIGIKNKKAGVDWFLEFMNKNSQKTLRVSEATSVVDSQSRLHSSPCG